MKKVLLGLLLSIISISSVALETTDRENTQTEGFIEIDQKILIYRIPSEKELWQGFSFLALSMGIVPMIAMAPKKEAKIMYAMGGFSLALCGIPAAYFFYKAYKKSEKKDKPFIILSPDGLEDDDGNFYSWNLIKSIESQRLIIYSTTSRRWIILELKNNKKVTIETSEMAISNDQLLTLIRTFMPNLSYVSWWGPLRAAQ